MDQVLTDIAFLAFAALTVGGALFVVTGRKPFYCVMSLIVSMGGVAALFYLLSAPFLAAAQVMIYAGSVVVLFLMALMLLGLKDEEMGSETSAVYRMYSALMCLLFAAAVAVPVVRMTLFNGVSEFPAADPRAGSAAEFGYEVFSSNAAAYDLAGVLILAALIGTVYLAGRKK